MFYEEDLNRRFLLRVQYLHQRSKRSAGWRGSRAKGRRGRRRRPIQLARSAKHRREMPWRVEKHPRMTRIRRGARARGRRRRREPEPEPSFSARLKCSAARSDGFVNSHTIFALGKIRREWGSAETRMGDFLQRNEAKKSGFLLYLPLCCLLRR